MYWNCVYTHHEVSGTCAWALIMTLTKGTRHIHVSSKDPNPRSCHTKQKAMLADPATLLFLEEGHHALFPCGVNLDPYLFETFLTEISTSVEVEPESHHHLVSLPTMMTELPSKLVPAASTPALA